jgi:hypothetical protein
MLHGGLDAGFSKATDVAGTCASTCSLGGAGVSKAAGVADPCASTGCSLGDAVDSGGSDGVAAEDFTAFVIG